ncbi:hypothetical protein FHS95_001097 [Sphingomonas naasensis]|uniref:Uncharacterized protein n=1 Tax=Sphingomonas naasensis TaxID=1344951 RepID=A0A4S1W8S3_9SPHN|nr:hypothetical protein [Sphingomonas naasensis]NIJ19428.1 hypothetical protein [Sphingomonas naasensis]TGX39169.1 hypothetical protein E5A74_16755 [Sphingomonas naasensis]
MQLLGLGAMIGALGQAIRAIVGLKKVNDAVSNTSTSVSQAIDPSRMVTSLVIGAIAGSLASVSLITDIHAIASAQIVALLGAGYSGADFIEGFMSRVNAAPGTPAGQEAIGVATPAAATPALPDPNAAAAAPAVTGPTSDDAVG